MSTFQKVIEIRRESFLQQHREQVEHKVLEKNENIEAVQEISGAPANFRGGLSRPNYLLQPSEFLEKVDPIGVIPQRWEEEKKDTGSDSSIVQLPRRNMVEVKKTKNILLLQRVGRLNNQVARAKFRASAILEVVEQVQQDLQAATHALGNVNFIENHVFPFINQLADHERDIREDVGANFYVHGQPSDERANAVHQMFLRFMNEVCELEREFSNDTYALLYRDVRPLGFQNGVARRDSLQPFTGEIFGPLCENYNKLLDQIKLELGKEFLKRKALAVLTRYVGQHWLTYQMLLDDYRFLLPVYAYYLEYECTSSVVQGKKTKLMMVMEDMQTFLHHLGEHRLRHDFITRRCNISDEDFPEVIDPREHPEFARWVQLHRGFNFNAINEDLSELLSSDDELGNGELFAEGDPFRNGDLFTDEQIQIIEMQGEDSEDFPAIP